MRNNAWKKYLELANKNEHTLKNVATPCMDDHQILTEDREVKGVLSPVAARIVLKILYLARMARPELLWTVNSLAREVTKWTKSSDKRLHRLISYLHFTKHWVQVCIVGDSPEDCHLGLFADASFAGDLEDSKSTSGGSLNIVGPNTFVPCTWLCKKQGAVSHSSSEAEVIALDTCVRLEGIPALALWDEITEVLKKKTGTPSMQGATPSTSTKGKNKTMLESIDDVQTNVPKPPGNTRLIILEDNEAVIKMTTKGRSPNMRHVARTHRIDLDWLFERIREDPGIMMRYVNTKMQIADLLTKGSSQASQWNSLCQLSQVVDLQETYQIKKSDK
jgi:hypothetical protein